MTKIYGIKNCDTMKKAFVWLDDHGIEYSFHDYKKHGADKAALEKAVQVAGWENVINRRGTTWRKLDEQTKNTMDTKKAIEVALENPSIIKRPLLVCNDEITLGFNEDEYAQIFA